MRRRDFLAAAGLTGYSLFVRAEGAWADSAAQVPAPPREIRDVFDVISPEKDAGPALAREPHMSVVDLNCDVLVAGGGLAGVCAAVSAARHGAKVVLIQDRSRLGGNSSSEVKMHVVGADNHTGRPGWREGGLIEEFRLDDAVNNPQRCWELWDLLLYDKCVSEPNIVLLLDAVLFSVAMKEGKLDRAMARCDKSEHLYRISAKIFCDCTGDSRLALEAGAEMRFGRESRAETGETLALKEADSQTLGSSILFTARDHGKPMPFTPPKWARRVTKEQLRFRPVSSWEYGYWWIEWGGQYNTIKDNERIRFELLAIVMGVWDYVKNSGQHPSSANWALDWVGMMPGKREARRVMGDYLLHQDDVTGIREDPADAVAIGGWPMDNHPPGGFDDWRNPPYTSIKLPAVYNIPLRSLCCKSVSNLMMAGRNISQTHVAFTSTRVMATCAVMGQAAGTAAAFCATSGKLPRQIFEDKSALQSLQQMLLRDDQTIKGRRNEDPADLARMARVTASGEYVVPEKVLANPLSAGGKSKGSNYSKTEGHVPGQHALASHVINGFVRDVPGSFDNRWACELGPDGAWIELAWDKPQKISLVQITFDTGFHRQLTLSSSDSVNATVIRAPQPETVRDYEVLYRAADGNVKELARVEKNHQRLCRHLFEPVEAKAIRIHVRATNGDKLARIYEVRCYA